MGCSSHNGSTEQAVTTNNASPRLNTHEARRPEWLKVKVTNSQTFGDVKGMISRLSLNTVCQEARCPNIWECWGTHRTATFMILGAVCTRACRYCSIKKGRPRNLPDIQEPEHVADAVAELDLAHAVITSVDRDDLEDCGSNHWKETIQAIHRKMPKCRIEVLTPDFQGRLELLENVLQAPLDIYSHNIETVPRLFPTMRRLGNYARSLSVLSHAVTYKKQHDLALTIKSGLMVGLGEQIEEIIALMDDLRGVGVEVMTIGQYLNPTRKHAAVQKFYSPDEFAWLKEQGLKKGFAHVESGPLVRSSYHAHEHVISPERNPQDTRFLPVI